MISRSSWEALHAVLKAPDNPAGYFWIDTLCINQSGAHERSHQVGLMGEIYSMAVLTYVYMLGQQEEGLIERAVAEYMTTRIFEDKIPSKKRSYYIWRQFLSRPYWRRMWILQEFIVSRDICFMYRDSYFLWSNCEVMYLRTLELYDWGYKDITREAGYSVVSARRMRREASDQPLLYSVARWRDQECMEPRDRVFALLDITAPCTMATGEVLRADYTRSAEEILKELLEAELRATERPTRKLLLDAGFAAMALGVADSPGIEGLLAEIERRLATIRSTYTYTPTSTIIGVVGMRDPQRVQSKLKELRRSHTILQRKTESLLRLLEKSGWDPELCVLDTGD